MTNNDMIKEMANNLERLLLLRKLVSKYASFFTFNNPILRQFHQEAEQLTDDELAFIVDEDEENDRTFIRCAGQFHRALSSMIATKTDIIQGMMIEHGLTIDDLDDDEDDEETGL